MHTSVWKDEDFEKVLSSLRKAQGQTEGLIEVVIVGQLISELHWLLCRHFDPL